jgi:lysophospholipase L1-like esterase
LDKELALDVLDAGMSTSVPTLLVNEPILISNGLNSDIRYNFFYPRWAYDEYRVLLAEHASEKHWSYLDLWDLVPMDEFTNSGVHLTPYGESLLANKIAEVIQSTCK